MGSLLKHFSRKSRLKSDNWAGNFGSSLENPIRKRVSVPQSSHVGFLETISLIVHPRHQIDHLNVYPYEDMNGYGRWGMCQWEYILYVIYSYIYKQGWARRGRVGRGNTRIRPRFLKKFPNSSQTRSLKLNPVPWGAGRGGYPKKPALLPFLNPINLVLHQFGGRCTVVVEPLNHSGIRLPGTELLDSICGVYGTIWVMKIIVKLYGNK